VNASGFAMYENSAEKQLIRIFLQFQSPQALRTVNSFMLPVVPYPRFQSFLFLVGDSREVLKKDLPASLNTVR